MAGCSYSPLSRGSLGNEIAAAAPACLASPYKYLVRPSRLSRQASGVTSSHTEVRKMNGSVELSRFYR